MLKWLKKHSYDFNIAAKRETSLLRFASVAIRLSLTQQGNPRCRPQPFTVTVRVMRCDYSRLSVAVVVVVVDDARARRRRDVGRDRGEG